MAELSPKCVKIFKTCNLYICFFFLAMCNTLLGPCLLDLQRMVKTDTQHIAFVFTARSIGYLIGAVFGGIILDTIKAKQVVMTIFIFAGASSVLAVPWSRSLGTLTGFMVVIGVSLGTLAIGGNVMCLSMWGSDCGPFYQALHFSYGLGGFLGPLIAAPFLGDFAEKVNMSVENATFPGDSRNFTSQLIEHNDSASVNTLPNIIYPFSINGAIGQLATFMFLLIYIKSPTEEKALSSKSSGDPKRSFAFMVSVIFLTCLMLFMEIGAEVGYAQMLTAYVVKSRLQLSASKGSYMTSTFWATLTISRLTSVFFSIKFSSLTLIVFDLVVCFIASLIIMFLASNEWALWLTSVLLGVGLASFFPAVVAWLNSYIDITIRISSLFTIAAVFGEMVVPFAISYFIDTIPDILIYVIPTSCISSSVMLFLLYMVLRNTEKKNVNGEVECPVAENPSLHI